MSSTSIVAACRFDRTLRFFADIEKGALCPDDSDCQLNLTV